MSDLVEGLKSCPSLTDYFILSRRCRDIQTKVGFSKRANEDEEEEQTLYYPKKFGTGELEEFRLNGV